MGYYKTIHELLQGVFWGDYIIKLCVWLFFPIQQLKDKSGYAAGQYYDQKVDGRKYYSGDAFKQKTDTETV